MSFESVLASFDFVEVSAMDAYRDIFCFGSGMIQQSFEPSGGYKSNPILYFKNDADASGHYRVMFEDEFEKNLIEASAYDFAIMNGVSYFGRKATIANASKMYAITIDLDGQTDKTLRMFLGWASLEMDDVYRIPMPNYIALSGHNIHCYWCFDAPLNLFPNTKMELKQFKYALIEKCWNADTSTIEAKQFQGINQGFRPFSCKTKIDDICVRVFKSSHRKWTIEELNRYVPEDSRVNPVVKYADSKYTLDEAKELFPEWYKRRIENKQDASQWAVSRNLYEWFIRQIKNGATYHHRYFCIMCLAAIGARCSVYDPVKNPSPVTFDEVERDAFALKPFLNMVNPEEPFTDDDIHSALEGFNPDFQRIRIETVEKFCSLGIQRNIKRTGRTKAQHMEVISAIRDVMYPDGSWRNKDGRPSKKESVFDYLSEHPGAGSSELMNALDISRPTALKWLKMFREGRN